MGATSVGMSATPTARLWLDVRLEDNPLSGEVSTAGGQGGSFSGWTELFALLDATLKEARALARRGLCDQDHG